MDWTRWVPGVIAVAAQLAFGAGGCVLPTTQPCAAADTRGADDDASDDDATDDDTGGDDTGDDDTGDDDTGPGDDSIYDIQLCQVPEGTQVQVDHVVVTSPVSIIDRGFFVQEPGIPADAAYSGIWLYTHSQAVAGALAGVLDVGMTVDARGVYQEYNGRSEIVFESASDITATDTPQLNPASADACDVGTGGSLQEAYEGVLVWISNASVTDTNPDYPGDYGEFEVNGCLRVDDMFFDAAPGGDTAYQALIGVMYYSLDNAKLEPRIPGDVLLD